MKLLLHPPVDVAREALIREAAGTMHVINAADDDIALREIADADAFYGKLTPDLLARASALRWVQSPTASLEHYLFPELIAHPCQLSNMRGLFSDVIADHVLLCVLAFARNLPRYLRQQQAHCWEPVGGESERSSFASGPGVVTEIDRHHRHLGDCTLGVVGVGAIGAEVARRAAAFSMTLLGIDPRRRSLPGVIEDVWPVERLPDLLAASDYVVIAAPHTPATEKLFGTPQFQQMKSDAVLINVGRGIIVDLASLTAALQTGMIGGAALDVVEVEPLPADHPLWDLPDVILTPHVAAASPRIAQRHLATLLENVRRFSQGLEPRNLVDKSCWY